MVYGLNNATLYVFVLLFLLRLINTLTCEDLKPSNPQDCHSLHTSSLACCYIKQFFRPMIDNYTDKCQSFQPSQVRNAVVYYNTEKIYKPNEENSRLPEIINCGNYIANGDLSCGYDNPYFPSDCHKFSSPSSYCCFKYVAKNDGEVKKSCFWSGSNQKYSYKTQFSKMINVNCIGWQIYFSYFSLFLLLIIFI